MLSKAEEEKLKTELYELRATTKVQDNQLREYERTIHEYELELTEVKAKYYAKYSAIDDQVNKSITKYLLEIIVFLIKIFGGGAVLAGITKLIGGGS